MFPNENVVGSMVSGGAPTIPLPLSATDDGLPGALCVSVTVAVFAPTDAGVNVTVMVWAAAPALTVNAVEGLTVNCPAPVPDSPTADTDSAALPVLPTVKISDFVCPFCTSPKFNVVFDRLMAGCVPVPETVTVDGLPGAL